LSYADMGIGIHPRGDVELVDGGGKEVVFVGSPMIGVWIY